jgi:hypothetical protein
MVGTGRGEFSPPTPARVLPETGCEEWVTGEMVSKYRAELSIQTCKLTWLQNEALAQKVQFANYLQHMLQYRGGDTSSMQCIICVGKASNECLTCGVLLCSRKRSSDKQTNKQTQFPSKTIHP